MSTIPSPGQGVVRLPGEALNSGGFRGLVGRWAPINESPGGLLLYDSTRRGPAGAFTFVTVANWESSHLGPVIDFPAANSRVVVPSRAELEPLEVTVRAVFRTETVPGTGYVLSKGLIIGNVDYTAYIEAAGGVLGIEFNIGVWRTHSVAGVIAAATWYDLVFSIGNGRARIWLNGALILDDAEPFAMPQTGGSLLLGTSVNGVFSFQGKLALVEIWNYCLPKPLSPDPHFLAHAG